MKMSDINMSSCLTAIPTMPFLTLLLLVTIPVPALAVKGITGWVEGERSIIGFSADNGLKPNHFYETDKYIYDNIVFVSFWRSGYIFKLLSCPVKFDYGDYASEHKAIAEHVSTKALQNCYNEPVSLEKGPLKIEFSAYDKNGTLYKTDPLRLTGTPRDNRCSVTVSDVHFPNLRDDESSRTQNSYFSVSCEGNTDVSVTVNNGDPLTDESGAIIDFHPNDVRLRYPDLTVSDTIGVEFKTIPKTPGVYRWSVPVVFNYD
ncbi:hypothetical protein E4T16_14735 [Vibrio parahaemolyticus]|nr:hypothetical protein [Vibrio parahaemolyticus]EGR0686860.1 hypothetical protein [Vibrio parahaemolyticus]